MLYRDVLCGLGGHAPVFLAALSRRHRARLREEMLAVYARYEQFGADNLRAAMALADEAGTYSAAALALLLDAPRAVPLPLPSLALPGVPPQAEVDRLLSVYEMWVQVDVATPEAEVAV